MEIIINYTSIINALIFSILGIIIFTVGFILLDVFTPYKLWKEIIEGKNLALAIVVSSLAISFALIIAFAIHG